MKSKATLKIVIDLAMTAALLFLMGYQFWSDTAQMNLLWRWNRTRSVLWSKYWLVRIKKEQRSL